MQMSPLIQAKRALEKSTKSYLVALHMLKDTKLACRSLSLPFFFLSLSVPISEINFVKCNKE
jgi:hypothetical protein